MTNKLHVKIEQLKRQLQPKFKLIVARWNQLQVREQQLLMLMGAFVGLTAIYLSVVNLVAYQKNLRIQVDNLSQLTVYSKQAANSYKQLTKVQANTFNPVGLEQIKGDVTQVLQIKSPDILIQDGQMTVNVPSVQYSQVVTLLEQFRRSYDLFPDQVNIIRLPKSGYVSFNAVFWVKQ